MESWPSYPIIFVTSSTGDGDPPENAETFWRQLRRKTRSDSSHLDHVRFLILGLGDSNYDSYQGFPLALYGKLTQLGAKPILPLAKADEATGSLEDFVEPWIADLWPDLETFFQTGETVPVVVPNTGSKPAAAAEASAQTIVAPSAIPAPSLLLSPPNSSASTPAPTPAISVPSTPSATPASAATSIPATPLPTLVPVPTPSGTPAPGSGTKTPKGPVLPKAPAHVSTVHFLTQTGDASSSLAPRFKPATFPPTKDSPYLAKVLGFQTLTSPDAVKEVCEMKLEICAGNILPGDAIGVWPQNCPLLTERMLKALKINNPDELFQLAPINKQGKAILPIHIPTPSTLRSCFLNHVNFTGLVSKRVLVMLAQYCANEASKNEIMELVADKVRFNTQIEGTYASVLNILERFPDCTPNLGHLLDSLSPLMPRYFSIANFDPTTSSSTTTTIADPSKPLSTFKFIFSIERTVLHNKTFLGVATNWLKNTFSSASSITTDTVPIFVRPRGEFLMPNDKSRPIIMCCAGTGLAPFMGFLEQRRHLISQGTPVAEIGKAMLFTGHRHPNMDWLYRKEVQNLKLEKDQVHTAFSRLHPNKIEYIQTVIFQEEIAKQVLDLMLNQDAVWFVCGDARKMATELRETIVQILEKYASMDNKQASEKILEWSKAKRYLLDIWG